MHYVYEITNLINNKKYIGKRSSNCSIEEDKYMGSGKCLKRAFKKYGRENFSKRILEICETEKEAFAREVYYIGLVKAWKNPMYYNISSGGEGGSAVFAGKSEEEILVWKKKMSESRKGRMITDEWKQKILKTRKERGIGVGKNNPMYGIKGKDNKTSKAVVMLSIDGEFIRGFDSLQLAKEYINAPRADSGISRSCISKYITAYGYRWLFKCDYDNLIATGCMDNWINGIKERIEANNRKGGLANSRKNSKKVIQLDANSLEIIELFDNCKVAGERLGIFSSSIRRCCLHRCNTAGGYSFIYEDEFNMKSKDEIRELYSRKYNKPDKSVYAKNKRRVICLNTGDVFDGIVDAIEFFNLCKGTKIDAACKGIRKTAGKHPITKESLRWAYYEI